MKPKSSAVWHYFNEIDSNSAQCKICENKYSRKGRTTTALKSHLKSMHPEEYAQFLSSNEDSKKNILYCETVIGESGTLPNFLSPRESKTQTSEDIIKKGQLWDSTNLKSMKIDDKIGEMIALHDLPFNFVEAVGFRRLMSSIAPQYFLRNHEFFTTHVCEDIYVRLMKRVKLLLTDFTKLSFTSDIWTEPSANISVLRSTCHGISDKDFRRVSIVLRCETFEDRHTDDVIAERFHSMLSEWDLSLDRVHAVIRDGGCNANRALNLAGFIDIDCTVHKIQLCVRGALESQEVLVRLTAKCKEIANHFKDSLLAQAELKYIQLEQLNQPALSVVQDNETRWKSPFHMMDRFIKIKDSLKLYTSQHEIPQIFPEEWLYMEKCVEILTAFEEATRELSSSHTTISSVIPLVYTLKITLNNKVTHTNTEEAITHFIKQLTDELNCRFGDLENNILFTLATYLDPRYKLKFFSDIVKEKVQSQLLSLIRDKSDCVDGSPPSSKKARSETTPLNDDFFQPSTSRSDSLIHNSLAKLLDSSDDESESDPNNSHRTYVVIKSLITEYNKEKRIDLREDPLLWWRGSRKYKLFAPIARQFLSAPPGSVSSEQFLSDDGLINNPLRNRLHSEKAAKLLFLKCNLPLLNFDY